MSELDGNKYYGKITKLANKYNRAKERDITKEPIEYIVEPSRDNGEER